MAASAEALTMAENKVSNHSNEPSPETNVNAELQPKEELIEIPTPLGEYYEATREKATELYNEAISLADAASEHSIKAAADSIRLHEAIEEGRRAYFGATGSSMDRATYRDLSARLVDPEGRPFEQPLYGRSTSAVRAEDNIVLMMKRQEFDELSAKTTAVITAAALAQERIAKDQLEIDSLKSETRQLLKRLRAA
jgi:hypothetical protein